MNLHYLFRPSTYLLLLFAAITFDNPLASLEPSVEEALHEDGQTADNSSDDTGSERKIYKYGGWTYFGFTTVADHLDKCAEHLSRGIYWLFENSQRAQSKQHTLKHSSPNDETKDILSKEITEEYQELKRLSNIHYTSTLRDILEYIEPDRLPHELSWQFGVLLGLYGSITKEAGLWNPDRPFEYGTLSAAENAKVLACYKISLLFFSYHFGFREKSPAVFQYASLDKIVSRPEEYQHLVEILHLGCANAEDFRTSPNVKFPLDAGIIQKLECDFQNEFCSLDETAWSQAMHSLDQQRLDHLCGLFRAMYLHFLENHETLSKYYVGLGARLCSLTAKLLLSAQKNPHYNLDAVNPWMFKLYIDLKKWQTFQMEEAALTVPEIEALLPEVQKRCAKLLPREWTWEDLIAENEQAICDEVRKRNLLPDNQKDVKKGEEITDEFEFSPSAMRQAFIGHMFFFDVRAHFLRGYEAAIRPSSSMTQEIYNYLSGYIEMCDISLTKDNALDYLLEIKLFDLLAQVWNSNYHVKYEYAGLHFGFIGFGQFYFPRTTYELRKKILKLCPHLKSYEALTISVNPLKVKNEKDQATPGAWIDESEMLRQTCIAEMLQNALHLSDLIDHSPLQGIIVGVRGISGAGKSTYIKRTILPLIIPEWQNEPLQIDAWAKGILNPDTIKASLKKLQGDTLNAQVHHEGSHAFQRLFSMVSGKGSYILDKRHLTPHEIVADLVEPAKESGKSIWLFDFDISLASSITRILARPIHGEDPCPDYEALIDGFRSVRRYRSQVLALASNESAISKYELYATSKQRLIAHKINGEPCPASAGCTETLCVHDLHLFDECLIEPDIQKIEEELSQVITDSFISQAIIQGDISFEQREMLEKWRGLTLKESIQRHVQGSKGVYEEGLFESVSLSPFNGTEWLADFPQLIEFLQCEHRLHIHGADETGRGLHWEAGQIETGLNPKYNPGTKLPGCRQGGIQMRVGYFIVPMDKLDIYLSENLSPAVTRELAVRDQEGQLTGLRFFVHPEAYAHFAPLLRAGIAFVPPSQSEFMGTPLSSYNSWLLRRVSTPDRKPFIVKMGTPNGMGDIKHLFAAEAIVRSLWLQKKLDQLPERPDLVLFKETVGLILNDIEGYPEGTIDSGIVICELPELFFTGDCKILSLSAAMSYERIKPENSSLGALDSKQTKLHQLPLIFELMDAAIQKGLVKTPGDFFKTYLIDAYLQAIEPLVFKNGYSLGGQGQNLYLVLNTDNTIKGFAYRDLEGVNCGQNFLESYSWFYRYANFVKLLNVITLSENDDSPPLLGGPIRAGIEKPASERNLYFTLSRKLEKEGDSFTLEELQRLSITPDESLKLLKQLDSSFLVILKLYFEFDETVILNADGTVPCVEKGSVSENALFLKNRLLWEGRVSAE